jgi:hypothetical protein
VKGDVNIVGKLQNKSCTPLFPPSCPLANNTTHYNADTQLRYEWVENVLLECRPSPVD